MKKSKKSKKQLKKKNHNKLLIALVVFVGILISLAGWLYLTRSQVIAPDISSDPTSSQPPVPEQAFTPYTASFQIVIDGETRTFTDPRYHNKSAEVYISPEGSRQVQITVAQPNITWGILFSTLPMSVTKECIVTGTQQTFCTNATRKLRFYINGVESPEALITVIEPSSQLKIVY